ncbi:hypothetical protein V2J09_009605 [Rumex salicifolius]
MKMKLSLKLRTALVCFLFLTVVSPLLFYTDTLATFSSSSSSSHSSSSFSSSSPRDQFIEEISKSTFNRDTIRQLNALPKENPAALKELSGEKDVQNSRQLQEESVEHKSRVLSTTKSHPQHSKPENPIHLVTDQVQAEKQGDILQAHEDKIDPDGLPKHMHIKKSSTVSNQASHEPNEMRSGLIHSVADKKPPVTRTRSDNRNSQTDLFNARVRYLKDQLVRARVYLSLSATRNNARLVRDLRQRVKEIQKVLGDATKGSELPKNAYEKLKAMDQILANGKQIQDDCSAMVKKLRAILHSTEEQLRVNKKQSMFLAQLTAKTLPKGLHCLPLRLSSEYYALNDSQQQFPNQEKLDDPLLYHYALFSDNILAAAVVVNSTIFHAKDPSRHVIHIVTDRLNYAAMRMWFLANPPSKATVQVQNIEEFTWLNSSYSPVLQQLGSPSMINYYFKAHHATSDSNLKFRNPKYLSMLNHLRFYLPEIFPKLNKVVFLDDDIVVKKDLTGLWAIDLKGNVNGAVETCGENFHRFDRYLNFSNPLISKNFDPHACGWAYGMNIFDLDEWKRQNITEVYHNWQKLNHDRQLWKLGTLPPGLITFWKRTFPLDKSWHVLGLGYNPNVNLRDIEKGAVIHYNGNMKPWLEIGLLRYRNYWSKYIDHDQVYLRECNITP